MKPALCRVEDRIAARTGVSGRQVEKIEAVVGAVYLRRMSEASRRGRTYGVASA